MDGYMQAVLSRPVLLACSVCPVLLSLPAPACPHGCYHVIPSVATIAEGRGARNTRTAYRVSV